MYGANRKGDNLYSDSLVALDPDTGALKWHFQFTPHDVHDWDATHTPILIDDTIDGTPRKLVAVANRNGFFYTLDRVTGKFLRARAYTKATWATHIDEQGRPVLVPNMDPSADGHPRLPERHRRHQLAFAVVQPDHPPDVLLQQRTVRHVHGRRRSRAAASCRTSLHRQRLLPRSRRARRGRGPRGRSQDRRHPLGVPAVLRLVGRA